MKLKVILNSTGLTLKHISIIFIFPVIFALFYKEYSSIPAFIISGIITFIFGVLFCLNDASEKDIDNITRTEALLIVLSVWGMFALVCAMPFMFFNLSFVDSLFESVSGISTTGASILADYSLYPKTFFIYRSLLHWFGGMGIIVLFIAILPKFAVAGRQMFFAEAANPREEKITPRIRHTASRLWTIYIILTVIQILILKFMGLDLYNALCTVFATISAGGFTNTAEGHLYYAPKFVWVIGFFAFLAGSNFLLLYRVLINGKIGELFKNEEFKVYTAIIAIISLSIAAILVFEQNANILDALRNAFYETASTMTSTGSACADYTKWPLSAQVLIFILMFIGASALSTGGGIKVARWIYIIKFLKRELKKIAHPNLILPVKLDNRVIPQDIGRQIVIFIMFFMAFYAISAIIVAFIEQDAAIAITGSITMLSNTGPGMGAVIGPMGGYSEMHTLTKLIFTLNMFAGRLEIIPFLAILNKDLWQIKR